jgi:hypothetical protein
VSARPSCPAAPTTVIRTPHSLARRIRLHGCAESGK